MKTSILFFCMLCLFYIGCSKDEDGSPVPSSPELSDVRGYANWYIGTFRCGIFVPPSYDPSRKYPLVVYLHGHSDTTSWDMKWYHEPFLTTDPCIVLTPKCPVSEIYGWGDSFDSRTSPMMSKAFDMITLVEAAFNVDKDRYYIHGTSMGGYGTYGVLQKHPGMFAAAFVQCGKPNLEIAPIIKDIPIWIFHGSDDPIVPVQPDRDLYQAVLNLGGQQIRYTEYPGVAHNVWDYTKNESTLYPWLLMHRRGTAHNAPNNVTNFRITQMGVDKIMLDWEIPQENLQTHDNKIWYCRIFRNDVLLKEVYNNQHGFVDSTFTPGILNKYNISAVNYNFRESVLSSSVSL